MAFGGLKSVFNSAAGANEPQHKTRQRFFTAVMNDAVAALQKITQQYPLDAVRWRNEENMTGLMVAAREGHEGSAAALIRAGSDIEAVNENGSTPLMFAAFAGKAVVAVSLLEAGANVNHINQKGHTPVMSAAAHGYKNTLKVLLENGAEIRTPDKEGSTALDYAKDNGYKEIVGMLVRRGQILDERGPVAKDFSKAAPRPAPIPAPANANVPEPGKQAVYDENSSALRDLEKRMRNARLF